MPFDEAFSQAKAMKKDIVLRNARTEPPVVKITNYRKDLLRKLFHKLGENKMKPQAKENKPKAIHLTTTITVHDLENKKKKVIEFLKNSTTLKVFMKVNIYDEANIQKGRLMLLNIAEDLKHLAKIKVSPANMSTEEDSSSGKSEKKPKTVSEVSKKSKAHFVNADQLKKTELLDDYDKDFHEGSQDKAQYLYMELESISATKEIDIDAMLEHTTME